MYCTRCLRVTLHENPEIGGTLFLIILVGGGGWAAYSYFGMYGVEALAMVVGIGVVLALKRYFRRANSSPVQPEQSALSPPIHGGQDELYYGGVLELKLPFQAGDIQEAYRRLASQYHPDKVQHLGAEIRALAEQKSREINAAYEFFRERYGSSFVSGQQL